MIDIKILRNPDEKAILRDRNLSKDFMFFSDDVIGFRSYIAAFDGENLVGLIGFTENSFRVAGAFGIGFITTHVQHRKRGIARLMIVSLFALASAEGKDISNTPYEPDVKDWLSSVMAQEGGRYSNVVLHER